MTEIPSCILFQYNYFLQFPEKNINYVSQVFNNNGSVKK